jgi:RNA polymerase sigma-70 factor (ECF subfamily)
MSRYSSQVYRLAHGIMRNSADDAEEVVQDVFLTLMRKGDTFEGRSALGSWIYPITTNAALDKRRGKRGELEISLDELLPTYRPDGHREGARVFVLADWWQNPEEDMLSNESRANEEAADILGESAASVRSRWHRWRMALREQLTHYVGARS